MPSQEKNAPLSLLRLDCGHLSAGERVFYFGIVFMLVSQVIFRSFLFLRLGVSVVAFYVISLIIFIAAEFIETGFRFSIAPKALCCWATVLFACAVSALVSHSADIPVFAAAVVVGRHYDWKKTLKVAFLATLISVALVLALCSIGVIENNVWFQRQGERVRYGLGFRYASFFALYAWYLSLAYFCVKDGRVGVLEAGAMVCVALAAYLTGDTRLPFVLSLFLALIAVVPWKTTIGKTFQQYIPQLVVLFMVVCCIASIFLMVAFDKLPFSWVTDLDNLLGKRLSICNYSYSTYGVKLFGQDLDLVGQGIDHNGMYKAADNRVTYIDNSICDLFVRYGVVFGAIFLSLFCALAYKLAFEKKWPLLIAVLLVFCEGLIDNVLFSIACNPTLLLIGPILLKGALPQKNKLKVSADV